jgi:Asp-tRNA(Asn)/Glu-tRNA(Gln) amidotransferase A subunit family amidase
VLRVKPKLLCLQVRSWGRSHGVPSTVKDSIDTEGVLTHLREMFFSQT